ncbi:glutamate-cysteine ligase family protein [Alcaligenes endophyticus]|uniref:Glutamate--cysteine ligase n=1 Tax=Alcaligenes endophyticus TaxID=1929088 RepID=A0ABT8EFP0_9BURK|nr:glutamate-cysteine ligase family protein [Alcaligenes endophyticus]MCX5590258.1 glutamate-cysteine ligase family protein [Alcaligenes endophyticus]MDN4120078.1 hypothetical protein [Alcaligenes endophyticus]
MYTSNTASTLAGAQLGLELEMGVVSTASGQSAAVNNYFAELQRIKAHTEPKAELVMTGDRATAVQTSQADCGLDNGFNLLETALRPVASKQGGLLELARRAGQEVSHSLQALQTEGLTILNAAQHPQQTCDVTWYRHTRVDRPIYQELTEHRGWAHHLGLDAKAQNGANTQVPVQQAVAAMNTMLALAPAFIALFANSPLEAGQQTTYKENRLTLWPRMFAQARFAGDRHVQTLPNRPFHDLADYFLWMFGRATVSRSLPLEGGQSYKSPQSVLLCQNLSLQDFLYAGQASAHYLGSRESLSLQARSEHFVYSQIAMFLDARLRYSVQVYPPLLQLLRAWEQAQGLEQLLADCGAVMYIEGRAPGANFPDAVLLQEAGSHVALSSIIAPQALQLGLLRNVAEATQLWQRWGWEQLAALRVNAMTEALDDLSVLALCQEVLEVALDGLDASEQSCLAYVQYGVQAKRCGADRLLASWRRAQGLNPAERLQWMLEQHQVISPNAIQQ